MDDVFDKVLLKLETTFRRLEAQVPPPVKVAYKDGFVLRYNEQTYQQAMLQKFARQISGLHALCLLLENGFLQEMGVIQRTLDDFEEDILFITCAAINDDWTDRHSEYLKYHWIEERGEADVVRPQVPRKHIRAYVAKYSGGDPSSQITAGRSIYKTYSGFVHGSGEAILDMCMNDPSLYLLSGMTTSPLYPDHEADLWNYMYRGLVSSTFMAKLFDDQKLWNDELQSIKAFEKVFANKLF